MINPSEQSADLDRSVEQLGLHIDRLLRERAALLTAVKHQLPYAENSVRFFAYQRAGHEFWPNREEAEANIAEMRAAVLRCEARS